MTDALTCGTGVWQMRQTAQNRKFRAALDTMQIKETKMTDFTKPVQTRSGLPVTIITTEGRGYYPIVGYIGDCTHPDAWPKDGISKHGYYDDLINVPEKRVMYANMNFNHCSYLYSSRKVADANAAPQRIACIRVEYLEGQFDD